MSLDWICVGEIGEGSSLFGQLGKLSQGQLPIGIPATRIGTGI
jgi:hypothetical protein